MEKLSSQTLVLQKTFGVHVKNLRGFLVGAEDEVRTRDPQLGRLMLYRLSYFRSLAPFFKGDAKIELFAICPTHC